jgi:SAM-dependent methyltransferase
LRASARSTPAEPPAEIAASGAPLVPTEAVDVCTVCGSIESRDAAWGYDYELLTCRNCWRFVSCESCSLVRLDPRPAVQALPTIYPSEYYAYSFDEISPVARAGKAALDRLKFRGIKRILAQAPESYLDIGCGDGRYLRAMEAGGMPRDRLYGLELTEQVVAPLAAAGYQVFCERVEDCERIATASLDLITMFHVIEHVADPRSVVSQIAEWLAPGGVFALETPNIESLDRRLFRETWWGGYHIPRHWTLFSPTTLRRLLQDCGLEVVAMRFQPGHAFWMYSLHHRLRYGRRRHPRLASLFDPFSNVITLAAFTAFDKVRALFGAKTSAMLMVARKPLPQNGS